MIIYSCINRPSFSQKTKWQMPFVSNMLSSWNTVIIIITETAIYKDQRGITKIHKGYGSYPLHVVLFCLIFVWYFIKISWMLVKLQSGHYFVTEQLLTNTTLKGSSYLDNLRLRL